MERAKTIINDLDRCLREFAQREPYRVSVNEHPDKDGSIIGNLTAVKNPRISRDPNIVLMVGEALYHLRSSLDHLIHQLVLLNDPSFDVQKKGRLQFPIFDSGGGYISSATGMIKGVSPLVASLIEGEQPYRRSPDSPHKDALWFLRELNNTDKHRMIPVTFVSFGTLAAHAGVSVDPLFHVDGPLVLEKDEVLLFSYRRDRAHEKIKAQSISCSVVFQQFESIGRPRELKQSLWEAWTRVSAIINRFEAEFFGF